MGRITNNSTDSARLWWRSATLPMRLIAVTSCTSIILWLIALPSDFFTTWMWFPHTWFALLPRWDDLLWQPWGVVTYMFVHADVLHLFVNMIWLYIFGKIFLIYLSPRQFLSLYLNGGMVAGLAYVALYNLMNVLGAVVIAAPLVGASGAVMAIVFGVAFYARNEQLHFFFLGSIKIQYFAIALFILDIFMAGSMQNLGGHIAHIGGALWGYLFAKMLRSTHKDITEPMQRLIDWVVNLGDNLISQIQRKHKIQTTGNSQASRPNRSTQSDTEKEQRQARIDKILDKIRTFGYDSLSAEEKKELFDQSKKL